MYSNQELGLCIEFGPVRVDSVRGGGIKSPLRRFTPSWTSSRVTCDCLLPFVHPLLSQVISNRVRNDNILYVDLYYDILELYYIINNSLLLILWYYFIGMILYR